MKLAAQIRARNVVGAKGDRKARSKDEIRRGMRGAFFKLDNAMPVVVTDLEAAGVHAYGREAAHLLVRDARVWVHCREVAKGAHEVRLLFGCNLDFVTLDLIVELENAFFLANKSDSSAFSWLISFFLHSIMFCKSLVLMS